MLAQIQHEIAEDPYCRNNFDNDGQRFIAWYLRRVLLRDDAQTRDDITDGANAKEIDAVIVDEEEQRIVVIQGKFFSTSKVDGGPIQEVLSAWLRIQKLDSLQKDCNERLKKKIEAIRTALDDDYRVEFELVTTGTLTQAAQDDLKAFAEQVSEFDDLSASLHLIDTEMLTARLAEAEDTVLPSLEHTVTLDPAKIVNTPFPSANTVIAMLPLTECLKFPGITDGRLFAKNVRQSLGSNNKVNRALKRTIHGDRVRDFLFYHNGITAICDSMTISADRTRLTLKGVSVVNGCQSLSTIYTCSERVRAHEAKDAHILFRFYEIKDRAFGDHIGINTNSQSAVKQRDLRSNDRMMVGLKKAFETRYPNGAFLTKRGEIAPEDQIKAPELVMDASSFGKCAMAWHCQRPNISHNENKVFDEYYKTLFRTASRPRISQH
jgi:AIPR protein